MTDPVRLDRDGEIAVILVENPPVNALSNAVRAGLRDAIAEVAADGSVEAVVLACAGRTFIAGADIREFGKPLQDPSLPDVIAAMEWLEKPLVAAIHGTALGGGFEVALGCHFRVLRADASVGLPEVKLGILPGAGGTQRLPRLIGPLAALKAITSGAQIPADEALEMGAVDAVVEGDVRAAGIDFARKVLAEALPLRRLSEVACPAVDEDAFETAAAEVARRARALEAPKACVAAVRAAMREPFAEGLAFERATFETLRAGEQSRAQRHVFFAERAALKVPGVDKGVTARPVASAAVIGAGTMGAGIAISFANAGIPVTLIDANEDALARGLTTIEKAISRAAEKGEIDAEAAARRLSLVSQGHSLAATADCDLVIEAVFEDMDLKQRIFAELDRTAKPGAILATNTSTLDVDRIAAATARPESVVGLHFFSPANVMRLLEIVRGKETASDVLKTAIDLGRKLGKAPVTVGVCYGFVGNRMLYARFDQMERLLLAGALPQEIDKAMTDFGFAMGPCAISDLAGIDVGWRARQGTDRYAPVADAIYALGRYGQKTGKGFYLYPEGARKGVPDPEIESLIVNLSEEHQIARRTIPQEEIAERLIFSMINEGARILEEGIALRPSDIDIVWNFGYGWPVYRGGPMFYADQVGLQQVVARLEHYAAEPGNEKLSPAPLLSRLAEEGSSFDAFGKA